jgi:hypothetical protein
MSVARGLPGLCELPAAGAFPLVIGSLRFDLTVVRKPPACRADERPIMCALVGRVTAVRRLIGCLSAASRIRRNRSSADSRECHVAA